MSLPFANGWELCEVSVGGHARTCRPCPRSIAALVRDAAGDRQGHWMFSDIAEGFTLPIYPLPEGLGLSYNIYSGKGRQAVTMACAANRVDVGPWHARYPYHTKDGLHAVWAQETMKGFASFQWFGDQTKYL